MNMEQKKFILVVEDSPTQAGQIEETLRRAGYASKLAHSGAEALRRWTALACASR